MSTVAERVKARKARRPIYVVVRKLIDPATVVKGQASVLGRRPRAVGEGL